MGEISTFFEVSDFKEFMGQQLSRIWNLLYNHFEYRYITHIRYNHTRAVQDQQEKCALSGCGSCAIKCHMMKIILHLVVFGYGTRSEKVKKACLIAFP